MDDIIGYSEEPIRPPAHTPWNPPKGHCEACGEKITKLTDNLQVTGPATCHVADHREKVCARCDRNFAHVFPQRDRRGN